MEDYITTYSKIHMSPSAPKAENIRVEDIAHALSLMVRANGHFPEFYSVGQHCIHCCEEAHARGYTDRVQLACLLHDASEAYLADITRPVKQHLSEYGRSNRSCRRRSSKSILESCQKRRQSSGENWMIFCCTMNLIILWARS